MAVAGSATNAHELLLPPPGGGLVRGAVLALLAHALLFVALTSAVQWRTSPPEAVTAELWSAVPQVAAPRAVESPAPPPPPPAPVPPKVEPKAEPAPPDPQIAIAKAEKEKAERLQREKALQEQERQAKKDREAEALKREQAEAKKREQQLKAEQLAKQKADDDRLAKLREDNLKRMMGQAGATGSPESTGTAARDAGPSKSYAGKLVATIKPNIVFTDTISGNPAAEVEVSAAPSGTILARRLVRSSGHKDWDDAVLRAIDRTGTLPRDTDGRVPPRIIVAFRPQE